MNSFIDYIYNVVSNQIVLLPIILILTTLVIKYAFQKKFYVKRYKISENKYQLLIENSHCIIFSLNEEADIIYLSPQFYKIFKNARYPKDVISKKDFILFKNKMLLKKKFNVILSVFNEGELNYFKIFMEPVINGIIGWNGVAYDITDRINLEIKLKESNEILVVTNNGLKELFTTHSFNQTIPLLLQNLCYTVGAQYAGIFKVVSTKINEGELYKIENKLELNYEWSLIEENKFGNKDYLDIKININKINIRDNYIILDSNQELFTENYNLNLAIPIRRNDILWGIICFDEVAITETNLSILGLVSANIGAAIELKQSNENLNMVTSIYNNLLSSLTGYNEQEIELDKSLMKEKEKALQKQKEVFN